MFSRLLIQSITGTELFQLAEDFVCVHTTVEPIVIPAGFTTDFATVPRMFWSFISSDDKDIREASVVHDYLYSNRCSYTHDRLTADIILRDGMRYLGAPKYKYLTAYYIVRIFGKYFYKKD